MRGTKPHIRIEREGLEDQPAPEWLSDDARGEWDRIVPVLAQRKILTTADLGLVENYCAAMGMVRELEREIQKVGAVQKIYAIDKEGNSRLVNVRKNPAVAIQSDYMNKARMMAAELGCTPVSRSRPSVQDDDDGDDLFSWEG